MKLIMKNNRINRINNNLDNQSRTGYYTHTLSNERNLSNNRFHLLLLFLFNLLPQTFRVAFLNLTNSFYHLNSFCN